MKNSPLSLWHDLVRKKDLSILDKVIDDNCVFYSPIVFKPQEGKRLTVMYLTAAFEMFMEANNFKYIKEIEEGHNAMLEFNAEIDGILIDGVDIITWNDQGLIVEFKVMVRPLKGVDKIKEKMLSHLNNMSTFQKLKLKGGMIWDQLKN